MNRRRGGWFHESHRHYLASKGISTRRYMAPDFKKSAEMLRNIVSDKVDHTDQDRKLRDEHIVMMREDYVKKFNELEKEGLITAKNADRFITEEFDKHAQRYLQRMYDRDQFRDALERDFKFYKKIHATKFNPFDWSGDVHGI